jgi:hypothetical protein
VKQQKRSRRWIRTPLIHAIRLKAPRAKKSPRTKHAMHVRWPMNVWTTGIVLSGVAGAALLTMWLQPSPRAAASESLTYNLPGPTRLDAGRSRTPNTPAATLRTTPARSPSSNDSVAAGAAPDATTIEGAAGNGRNDVTITGCLERDEDVFRLRDTTGTDAPKSRSWRSGFLKKHATAVDLVDAGGAARLPKYIGQRIAATGVLVNREMQVHSLQRLAASCN